MRGKPASEHPATRNVQNVTGSFCRSPPIRKMSCSPPKDSMTIPAPKKSNALEKGMGHEMKNCRRPCADAKRKKHVPDLADRRIGQNALEVMLRECAEARHQQCCRADDRGRELRLGRKGIESVRARNQIYARRHHRSRVDKGAYRSWAGHGVRQPGLQWQLRRFAYGAA